MQDNLVSYICIHSHSSASVKTFIYTHLNVILAVVNMVPYFHVLSVHRSYDPSNDQKTIDSNGNGLLCSVKVGSDLHSFLLTCCHIFLKEEEERTEMMVEDFTAAMLRCKEAKYEFSGRDSMKAKEVLEDCENPVIYFHQVSGWRVQLY